jgi:hypothetical protein
MGNEESAEKHFGLAVDLARDALKALLLINGGAVSALIALADKAGRDYSLGVLLFGCGAIAAVISTALGYFSQLHYANHRLEIADGGDGTHMHSRHCLYQSLTL